MAWAQLQKRDNWGNISYYFLNSKGVKQKEVEQPNQVTVRWPDGHIETCEVTTHRHSTHINDMGHEYTQTSYAWYIRVSYHEKDFEVPIEFPEIKVTSHYKFC